MRGSYLHLQKNYYNKRQQSRNKTYNVQDGVDKDKLEYETEAEDVHEEVTEKSEAFLTPHLGSLGLMETTLTSPRTSLWSRSSSSTPTSMTTTINIS